ncbi:hypothetical protein C2869_13600 [Saccharobesus litoralis]|uniref:PIG-L family deacetylase n=1 Tax=Saccharobesus litoralis TaxID=2172099 RepID=A0A2S0VTI6_9ALTE|nr:PIG-L deacetylase family protein [Saccharobesus litoralis]AWB67410.1 hypothetical protein C2869_13600 [Saccharobesus litoralis]
MFKFLIFLLYFMSACCFSAEPQWLKNTQSVLVVLAHPDDETWLSGSLALFSQQKKHIQVIYATSGGAGKDRSGRGLSGANLAKVREQESIAALKKLGVKLPPIFWRLDDKQLEAVDYAKQIEQQLKSLSDKRHYELFISFGKTGITGHLDHIFIGEQTLNYWRDHQNSPYFLQVQVSDARANHAQKVAEKFKHPYRIYQPVANELVQLRIDVKAFQPQRVAAFNQYATQFPLSLQSLWKVFTQESSVEEFSVVKR